jgi:serine phosphatase RsbU (regulator of sigma subunit)
VADRLADGRGLDQCALAAMRVLTRSAHLASADDLPALAAAAGAELGADRVVLHLVDYDQVLLVPLGVEGEPMPVEGTLAGRAYSDVAMQVSSAGPGRTVWTPLLDGTDRLGVLEAGFSDLDEIPLELQDVLTDVAALLAELVTVRSVYGDLIERTRRQAPMTIPAELQWRLLPPLTFVTRRAAVAGVLLPTSEIAGDTFDYALNGDTLHVALLDAMGHGLEAALLATVAVSALRNARRSGFGPAATAALVDEEVAGHFGPDKFITGVIGELDTSSGAWTWTSCGHPPALVVRGGKVVRVLDQVVGPPLGLGLLAGDPETWTERLEPGDRLLLYTDGVIEARDADGEFFGTDRLVDLVTREAAAGRPVAEALRRLNDALLAHQEGALQDDATTVTVEWLVDEADRSTP